jgi:hypothetical protein
VIGTIMDGEDEPEYVIPARPPSLPRALACLPLSPSSVSVPPRVSFLPSVAVSRCPLLSVYVGERAHGQCARNSDLHCSLSPSGG